MVRTKQILGEPTKAVLEKTSKCTKEATKLAKAILPQTVVPGESSVAALRRAPADPAEGVCHGAEAAPKTTRAAGEGAGAAEGVGTAAKTLRVAAKGVAIAGFALDAGLRAKQSVAVERAYNAGQLSRDQRNYSHTKNAVGMAGGWGGAAAGEDLGAKGGAVVGSAICPGVGTIVGGIVGGVGGGIGGYLGGEYIAENLLEMLW